MFFPQTGHIDIDEWGSGSSGANGTVAASGTATSGGAGGSGGGHYHYVDIPVSGLVALGCTSLTITIGAGGAQPTGQGRGRKCWKSNVRCLQRQLSHSDRMGRWCAFWRKHHRECEWGQRRDLRQRQQCERSHTWCCRPRKCCWLDRLRHAIHGGQYICFRRRGHRCSGERQPRGLRE